MKAILITALTLCVVALLVSCTPAYACSNANGSCNPSKGQVCCNPTTLYCRGSNGLETTGAGSCKPRPPSPTLPSPTTSTTRPSPTTTLVPTTTIPSSSTTSTTLPPTGTADTWRPDYIDVSLGSAPKHIHPLRGDYCDQRCLFLRIEKRAFDAWPRVIKYLRELGLADEVRKQVNPTAGLPMVSSEVGIENSGRELNQGKSWNFGPDYDWRGNVEGNLRRAREAIINHATREPITVPADVQQILDLWQPVPTEVPTIGNPEVRARAAGANAVRTTDTAIKLRGLVSAKTPCEPLTPAQEAALQRTMDVHAANSAYRKANGVGRPGGAEELMAAHRELEALARNPDELTLFTIPAFAQHLDPTYDEAVVKRLMDAEDATHHCWATAVRLCYTNPRILKARAWSCGNEHTRAHLFGALNAGMALRVSVDAPLIVLGSTPPCTDRTLDKCPNLPFPPP